MLVTMVTLACKKEKQVNEPALNVTANTTNIKVGQELSFNISGNAAFVSFYSGEPLNDYAFKDDRTVGAGIITLSFDSYTFSGTQPNQLSAVISTDFSGVYDITNIRNAHWSDITSRYTLATVENTWAPAGNADITDKVQTGTPFYIAFKYTSQPTAVGGVGKIWKVRNLLLTNKTEIGTTTLANLTNAGWQLVYDENGVVDITRNFAVATALSFRANAAPKDNVYQEVWIISKVFKLDKQDLGPDLAVSVKSFTEPWVNIWKKTYATTGTYNATFVGANSNVYGDKRTVKQLKITVTP